MNAPFSIRTLAMVFAAGLVIPSCASPGVEKTVSLRKSEQPSVAGPHVKSVEHGIASWYSIRTNGGTHTASGRRLCNHGATAAHKTLPMGTKVRVTNKSNGRSEVVTITDRGPYIRGRVIDLTIGSAERLGFRQRGIVPVKVEVLSSPRDRG
jgi:rare lipoprotein A